MTMAHQHPCTFCGMSYDCDAPFERNFDGWPDPVCSAQTEPNADYQSCPGCRENGCCEECGERPATGDGHRPFFCEPCEDEWLDNYSGPEDSDYSSPSILEIYDAAQKQRRDLRRLDR